MGSRRVLVPEVSGASSPLVGGVVRSVGGATMGTTWSVSFVAVRSVDASLVAAGIERRLTEVVDQMSTWLPTSALSLFNVAPAGSWHALRPEFYRVLRCALDVAALSAGAFDPTSGSLVNAWGFGPVNRYDEASFALPSPEALDAARSAAGWQRIVLDDDSMRIMQPGGAMLDLSAIAKGFAVDHVARYLHELGIDDCLVEIGGELRGDGLKPDGQPWWVELEQPAALDTPHAQGVCAPTAPQTVVALHELSVATSGDYRRFHILDGRRRAHTIDPRTGRPIEHALASVSVLHRDCMMADAWSTALGVMGPEVGLRFADEHGIAALFVERIHLDAGDGHQAVRSGFREAMSVPMKALLA